MVGSQTGAPYPAVILAACIISGSMIIGEVDLVVQRLHSADLLRDYESCGATSEQKRSLYSPVVPSVGLCSCLFLAFWVDAHIWMLALALIAVGLVWHKIARSLQPP